MIHACLFGSRGVCGFNQPMHFTSESLDRFLEFGSGILDIIKGCSASSPRADTMNKWIKETRCVVSTVRLVEDFSDVATGQVGKTWPEVFKKIQIILARCIFLILCLKAMNVIDISTSVIRIMVIIVVILFTGATLIDCGQSVSKLSTSLAIEGEHHDEIKYRISCVFHNILSILAIPGECGLINLSPTLYVVTGLVKACDGGAYLISENLKPKLLAN